MQLRREAAVLLLALGLAACGGQDLAGPSTLQVSVSGAQTIQVLSGETGLAVAGAEVAAGGQRLTTDALGRVSAPVPVAVSIEAPGYLRRDTVARPGTAITLWPVHGNADAGFVEELVYNGLFAPDAALVRPTQPVSIVLSPALEANASARAAFGAATRALSDANGSVVFSVGPGQAVTVTAAVDASDPVLRDNPSVIAFTRVETRGHHVSGGRLVFRAAALAERPALVLHELGHAFGLGHSSAGGLMSPLLGSQADFTAAERLVLRMMAQRVPGNRAPDDDTGLAASGRGASRVVVCEG